MESLVLWQVNIVWPKRSHFKHFGCACASIHTMTVRTTGQAHIVRGIVSAGLCSGVTMLSVISTSTTRVLADTKILSTSGVVWSQKTSHMVWRSKGLAVVLCIVITCGRLLLKAELLINLWSWNLKGTSLHSILQWVGGRGVVIILHDLSRLIMDSVGKYRRFWERNKFAEIINNSLDISKKITTYLREFILKHFVYFIWHAIKERANFMEPFDSIQLDIILVINTACTMQGFLKTNSLILYVIISLDNRLMVWVAGCYQRWPY